MSDNKAEDFQPQISVKTEGTFNPPSPPVKFLSPFKISI